MANQQWSDYQKQTISALNELIDLESSINSDDSPESIYSKLEEFIRDHPRLISKKQKKNLDLINIAFQRKQYNKYTAIEGIKLEIWDILHSYKNYLESKNYKELILRQQVAVLPPEKREERIAILRAEEDAKAAKFAEIERFESLIKETEEDIRKAWRALKTAITPEEKKAGLLLQEDAVRKWELLEQQKRNILERKNPAGGGGGGGGSSVASSEGGGGGGGNARKRKTQKRKQRKHRTRKH